MLDDCHSHSREASICGIKTAQIRCSLCSLFLFCVFVSKALGASTSYSGLDEQVNSRFDCCNKVSGYEFTADPYVTMAFGKTIGVDENYVMVGNFMKYIYEDHLYYLEGDWIHLHDKKNAGNLGIGVRFGDFCKGCGSFLYYDGRKICNAYFNQLTFGIEGWRNSWEVHLNLSLPLESYKTINRIHQSYSGGYFFSAVTKAYACKMASLFAGRRFGIKIPCFSSFSCIGLAGPYWISHSRHERGFGSGASIELRLHELLSWKTSFTYDSLFKARIETLLQVDIPFGCDFLPCADDSPYYRKPERFPLIPVDVRCHTQQNWN